MYAVVRSGGRQYKVKKGDTLEVERLKTEKDKKIVLKEVLLVNDDKNILIGKPLVKKAKVICEFIKEIKGKKSIAFKYRRRKDSERKRGHRQILTRLKVKEIELK